MHWKLKQFFLLVQWKYYHQYNFMSNLWVVSFLIINEGINTQKNKLNDYCNMWLASKLSKKKKKLFQHHIHKYIFDISQLICIPIFFNWISFKCFHSKWNLISKLKSIHFFHWLIRWLSLVVQNNMEPK